ncbi:endothelin-converting enzyme-like 1 [Scaptodrosophila lebanonensis]|uniref:Endothelin-converting enzyme-like 1 n=1 Tax=Drosophila lebanonensis TaxID=7225 RepID=A0A6J2TJ85_DROLE|nr:endothelin-converting enzyme-like 1 [Scaptodrosophila lebanonensis]
MLKLSLIAWLLFSLAWRTTPTNCRQTRPPLSIQQLLARNLQSYMDTTARPCENFYQYACGRWQQQHIDQLEFGDTLGLLDYELNRRVEQLLRRNDTEFNGVYQKLRIYYRSCKKVKPYNLKKYLQLIQPCFESGWYLLARNGARNWQASKFDWLAAIAKLRLYGLNGVLIKEEVLPRWDESNSYSIYLDKPFLVETAPMGQGAMIELLLDIGQTKRVANEVARQVDAFELQLHRLQELEDDEGPKEMQLGYLQQYMPQLQWLDYIRQLRGPDAGLDSTVIIQNIPYMRALCQLLERLPRETICNYIMLRFLAFLKLQGPAEISRPECVASLRRAMPLALSWFVGEHFYARQAAYTDAAVQQLFVRLKQRFDHVIRENRLQLEPPIVLALRQKLQAMRLQVGNSPRNSSPEYYEEYYERVELHPHNFYVNQLSLLRLNVEKNHEQLQAVRLNVSTEEPNGIVGFNDVAGNSSHMLADWLGSSSSPFYVKPRNVIVVPYGFLQVPIYHRNMSLVQQYAVLGFTLAHELLHGFDSSGIDYDNVGNIMGPSEEIAANQRFMQGLRCMQQELATGSRSLNEKLADYEGLRLVYDTYFNMSSGRTSVEPRDTLLPQFSQRQLFFIHFAQHFCGKVHRKLRPNSYMEHAVDELRVIQSLANFEQFSREFGCERRTKMQSKQRCRLW